VNVVLNTKLFTQSADTIICANQPVALSVSAEGYNLSYKWFRNDQIVQSASTASLSFTTVKTDDSGDYKCEISGSCGTITSNIIKLTVYPLTSISFISPDTEVPFGTDITLYVTADGHDLIYQWQKNGTIIDNSNTSMFFLQNLNAADIGLYRTKVTGTCGTEISDTIYVYVKKADFSGEPEVFIWPTITSYDFTVALSNDAYYNVRIYSTTGKKIREITNCRYQTKINISTFDIGVYIVEVYNRDFRKTIKVIRE
jgi:hypothetical protein